jgi:hypothetical protein
MEIFFIRKMLFLYIAFSSGILIASATLTLSKNVPAPLLQSVGIEVCGNYETNAVIRAETLYYENNNVLGSCSCRKIDISTIRCTYPDLSWECSCFETIRPDHRQE